MHVHHWGFCPMWQGGCAGVVIACNQPCMALVVPICTGFVSWHALSHSWHCTLVHCTGAAIPTHNVSRGVPMAPLVLRWCLSTVIPMFHHSASHVLAWHRMLVCIAGAFHACVVWWWGTPLVAALAVGSIAMVVALHHCGTLFQAWRFP